MADEAPVSRTNARHYRWAEICDGWRLADRPELSVIEERVPPGAGEQRHYHEKARQFFYILAGEAVLEIEGREHVLAAGSGIEVGPGQRHRFFNRAMEDVCFLVISAPSTRADRIDLG